MSANLELEVEQINKAEDDGEQQDTVDGFRKFIKRQLHKITGTKKDDTSGKAAPEPSGPKSSDQRVEDNADVYDFTYPERGLVVIINNEDFSLSKSSSNTFSDRSGSSYDASSLYRTFTNLGFKVWQENNLTNWQMVDLLKLAKDEYDHGRADCFVCVILSHGDQDLLIRTNERFGQAAKKDLLFGVNGKPIETSAVLELFSDEACPKLKGKPRLFFLQACRGKNFDDGTCISVTQQTDNQDNPVSSSRDGTDQGSSMKLPAVSHTKYQKSSSGSVDSTKLQNLHTDTTDAIPENFNVNDKDNILLRHRDLTLPRKLPPLRDVPVSPAPLYKDSLVMYATPPGYYAWRRQSGAWFIQTLCKVLDSEGVDQKSLLNILVQVSGKVAIHYESSGSEKKEAPVIESMLVKDIFFTKKGGTVLGSKCLD